MMATAQQQYLKLRLTCPAKTTQTGITLPAGAIGTVLDYQRGKTGPYWVVDFGLVTVINMPLNSPLVEIVNPSTSLRMNGGAS